MFRIFTGSKTTARQQERTTNQPIASNAPKTMNQEPTNCQLARRQELRTKNQVQGIKNQEPCTRYQVNSDLYSTFLLQCFLPHSLFLQSSDELHTRLLSIACQTVWPISSGGEFFLSVTLRIEPLFWRTSLTRSWCASPWKLSIFT